MGGVEVLDGVLGRRIWLPLDAEGGAYALADALGGRVAALAWLRAAASELERQPAKGVPLDAA